MHQPRRRLFEAHQTQVTQGCFWLLGLAAAPRHAQAEAHVIESAEPGCVERLHFVDDEPIALGRSYLPLELSTVDWAQVEEQPIYSILESVTGLPVRRADLAIRAQQADLPLARALGVKRGAALLLC